MKFSLSHFLTFSLSVLFLCGCGGRAERKAAEQERRIERLEAKVDGLLELQRDLVRFLQRDAVTNAEIQAELLLLK